MVKNLYSPSMLKSYLSCKYTIFNEVNEKKLNLKKIELTKNDQLRVEKGNVHEKNYLKELKKKFKKVIDLKNSDLLNPSIKFCFNVLCEYSFPTITTIIIAKNIFSKEIMNVLKCQM